MLKQVFENAQIDDSTIQPSTFRFRHPKTKKYMFHKMITRQEKQAMTKLKRRTKKKDPQYFSKMLKQQKKKMFVNAFIKKLKNSITLMQPPAQCKSSSEQVQQVQLQSLQLPKNIEITISLFLFIQIIPLLIFNSLSLIFCQVLDSDFLTGYNVFSFIIHLLEIIMKLLVKHNNYEKKKKYLTQNIYSYIYSGDSVIDCLVILGFLGQFIFNNTIHFSVQYICHFMILMKFRTLLTTLAHIQLVLIQNQYREEIWNLIKVFLFNFVIAHCLTIILIAMTNLNRQKNWLINKNIAQSMWKEKYIWGYYWATTIMLTVGFGDIVPTNQDQALCMIFIQTMSCIVLAYNINRVGSIISKIRSYDLEKNSNLKVFNQISEKTQIDQQTQDKITNYIKQSTIIKRNSNIQEQKAFISKLPVSFKEQLLKEMNKNIWNGMMFFRNLSEKSLLQLSKYLEKKLTHPQEIVYTRGHQVDVMIFNNGTFGLATNNGSSKTNGQIIQKYFVNSNQFRVASLDFLLDRSMNYDIKCIDYMIFYKITLKSFLSILQNNTYDYEYYFMIKEKDKYLLNEFQIQKCKICQNERHTMFKCPRLHYIPLKQHVIGKYKKGLKKKHLENVRSMILKRQKISDIDSLKQRINVKNEMIKIRLQICANRSQSTISHQLTERLNGVTSEPFTGSSNVFKQQTLIPEEELISDNDAFLDPIQQRTYFDMAFDKIKQNLEYKQKQYHREGHHGVWQVQCDLAHNYKFYFKQFNSQDLGKKNLKRKPKVSLA